MSSTLKSVRKATPETPLLENSSPEKSPRKIAPSKRIHPEKIPLFFLKNFFSQYLTHSETNFQAALRKGHLISRKSISAFVYDLKLWFSMPYYCIE